MKAFGFKPSQKLPISGQKTSHRRVIIHEQKRRPRARRYVGLSMDIHISWHPKCERQRVMAEQISSMRCPSSHGWVGVRAQTHGPMVEFLQHPIPSSVPSILP